MEQVQPKSTYLINQSEDDQYYANQIRKQVEESRRAVEAGKREPANYPERPPGAGAYINPMYQGYQLNPLSSNKYDQSIDSIVKIQSLLRGSLARKTAKRERLIRLQEQRDAQIQEQRDAQNFKIAMFAVSILAIANFAVFYQAFNKPKIKNPQVLQTTSPSKL